MHDTTLIADDSTARRRGAARRTLVMPYEIERLYLTDQDGRPQQTLELPVVIEAASSKQAAVRFISNEQGRLYVITVWRLGHRPARE